MNTLSPENYFCLLKTILSGQNLDDLVQKTNKFTCTTVECVNSAVEKINSLDLDEGELKQQLKESKEKLQDANIRVQEFSETVAKFFLHADLEDEHVQSMKNAIKEQNFKEMNDYVDMIRHDLEVIYKCYQDDLSPAYKKARELCKSGVQQCKAREYDAKNRQNVARIVGGGLALGGIAGGIGGGLAASAILGCFTFGIGTAVGVCVTAVAGAVTVGAGTAAATGVATHKLASYYEKMRVTFQNAYKDFDRIDDEALELKRSMDKVMKQLRDITDDANKAVKGEQKQFTPADLGMLLEGIKSAHKKIETYN